MSHITNELDKRIEFMYTEQKLIKEAHEIGIAQAKANYITIEKKCRVATKQLEATIGIIHDTEKRAERLSWYVEGLERRGKKEENRRRKEKNNKPTTKGSDGDDEEDIQEITRKGNEPTKDLTKTKEKTPKETNITEKQGNNKAEGKTQNEGETNPTVYCKTTQEWGGWDDLENAPMSPLSLEEPIAPNVTPPPPPPNQLQLQIHERPPQATQTQRKEQSEERNLKREPRKQETNPGKYENWAMAVTRASTQKSVLERIRELECQVFVDFKLEKGQADVWKLKNGRELTLKANEVANLSPEMDNTGKPNDVTIWGGAPHRGREIFVRHKLTSSGKLA